ncbi:fructose 1,6-bisphosphatase [Streptomyces sp. NRRL S-1813]|uniref:fructose 1,6-bisphosphatase n=1 Tax=Streptomyces sp. NRRL S-1813 TaxID=1463888 RepID=UPI000A6F6D9B|nr:fructose 1,6-bisphosphatase [Streptomyces sp. NRRL S-1813]
MLTLRIIKADTGGCAGHSAVHPDMIDLARRALDEARTGELLLDGMVPTGRDDLPCPCRTRTAQLLS